MPMITPLWSVTVIEEKDYVFLLPASARKMDQSRCEKPVAEKIEANEVIAAMREHIDRLPEIECTLLTCCYGAGMTHSEIGKAVGMSQQTVSNRIQHALNNVRANLSKAGIF